MVIYRCIGRIDSNRNTAILIANYFGAVIGMATFSRIGRPELPAGGKAVTHEIKPSTPVYALGCSTVDVTFFLLFLLILIFKSLYILYASYMVPLDAIFMPPLDALQNPFLGLVSAHVERISTTSLSFFLFVVETGAVDVKA